MCVCAHTEQVSLFCLSCKIAGELNPYAQQIQYIRGTKVTHVPVTHCYIINLQAEFQSIVTAPKIKKDFFFLLLGVFFNISTSNIF